MINNRLYQDNYKNVYTHKDIKKLVQLLFCYHYLDGDCLEIKNRRTQLLSYKNEIKCVNQWSLCKLYDYIYCHGLIVDKDCKECYVNTIQCYINNIIKIYNI